MPELNELTYQQAVTELESLLAKMQSSNCDIDSLAAMTRRASELLALCRSRLVTTENELRAILADLKQEQ